MSDRLGKALADILANNARKQVRTPRVNVPSPPVLSPVAKAGASNIGQAVQQAAYQSPIASPPPPRLTYAQQLGEVVSQRASNPIPMGSVGVSTQPAIPMNNIRSMAEDAVRTTRERQEQEWGIYRVNDKQVAMPSYIAEANGFELLSDTTTSDPNNVATMREHEWSYLNQDDETKAMIATPSQPQLGEAFRQVAKMSAPPEERAKALEEFATGAINGAMQNASDVAWDKNHAYVMVRANEGDAQYIVPRKEWEESDPNLKASFNVVTDAINEREYQSIQATGVVDDIGVFRSQQQPQVDSINSMDDGTAEVARQMFIQQQIDNGSVVIVDGAILPAGVEAKPEVTGTWFHELPRWAQILGGPAVDASGVMTTEDLPPAPEGFIWAAKDGEAELVIADSVPDGYVVIGGNKPSRTEAIEIVADPAAEGVMWVLETVVGGGMSLIQGGWDNLLPSNIRTKAEGIWDTYIQAPLGSLIEHMPEGRLKDALMVAIENPIAGVIAVAGAGQQANTDNIAQSILYPGETNWDWASYPFQSMPGVSGYVNWMRENPEAARDAYENGVDTDGDGVADVFRGDAVAEAWREDDDVGSGEWLLFQLLTDPLTYAAGTGVAGRSIAGAGRNIRTAAGASRARQIAGTGIEGVGRTLEVGSRVVEDVGDLGARYVLDGIGRVASNRGPFRRVSSESITAAGNDAQAATLSALARQTDNGDGLGAMGTLEPNRETGEIELVLNDESAATSGPNARTESTVPVDYAEMERLADEAYGIGTGQTVDAGGGKRATRTENGWEVTNADGEVVAEATTRAAAVHKADTTLPDNPNQVPDRYLQQPARPNGETRYIDTMPATLYNQVVETIGPNELHESVATQRASGTKPDKDGNSIPTLANLNESDRMAWMIMETAQSIDPTFQRQWERNWNGGNTDYMLGEMFRRADYETAMQYWDALAGNGGVAVPVANRGIYRGTSAKASVKPLRKNITSKTHRKVKAANAGVDNVYARLKYHPGDIYNPEFAAIVQQAANLDYNLRQRGLRYSGPDWMYDPITTLIPDDAPIRLRKEVRAMGDYVAQPVRVDEVGEFIARISLDDQSGLGVDIYRVERSQVPEPWIRSVEGEGNQFVEDTWFAGVVDRGDGNEFTVYSNRYDRVSRIAAETAEARGWTDFGFGNEVVDHVAAVEGPQEAVGSPQGVVEPEVAPVPDTESVSSPDPTTATAPTPPPQTADQSLAARLRQLLDEVEEEYRVPHDKDGNPLIEGYDYRASSEAPTLYDAALESDKDFEVAEMSRRIAGRGDGLFTSEDMPYLESVIKYLDPLASEADNQIRSSGQLAIARRLETMNSGSDESIRIALDSIRHALGPFRNMSPDVVADLYRQAHQHIANKLQKPVSSPAINYGDYSGMPSQGLDRANGYKPRKLTKAEREWRPRDTGEVAWPEISVTPEPYVPMETQTARERLNATLGYEQSRTRARQEAEVATGAVEPGRTVPELTEETVTDPTGTAEFPNRQALTVEEAPSTVPTEVGTATNKYLADFNELPDNSPRVKEAEARAGKPTPATHKNGPVPSGEKMFGRTLDTWEMEALTKHPFADGETLKDRLNRYFVEAGNKKQWAGEYDVFVTEAIDKAFKEYTERLVELFPTGVMPNWWRNGVAKLPKPVQRLLEGVAAVLRAPLKVYDGYSRWLRERILFNRFKVLHYPMTQYFGNQLLNAMTGDVRAFMYLSNPKNSIRAYQAVKAGNPEKFYEATGIQTNSQKMHAQLGTSPAPETRDVLRGRGVGKEGDYFMGQKYATEKFGTPGKVATSFLGSRFARDFGAAMDVVYREAIEYSETSRMTKRAMPDFRNKQIAQLEKWGMSRQQAIDAWKGFEDSLGSEWAFSSDTINNHFRPIVPGESLAIRRGRAERMARDWREVLNKNQKEVRSQIRFRAMAQPQTRADLVGQRVLAFHFFQSRQMWFMVNQMARHPFMINMYFNAMDELERIAEENDFPDYLQGWIRVMGHPFGRQLFVNPFSLLSSYFLFDQDDAFRKDGDGRHRKLVEKWIYDWTGFDIDLWGMVGVNPVIDVVTNATGMQGDTWAPDVLGINREATFLTLVVNTARAYGLIGDDPRPIGNWYDDMMRNGREQLSGLVSLVVPDVEQIDARSSEQSMDREIRAIMVDELEQMGIDPNSPEGQAMLAEAEMDPESDLYKRSLKKWIQGEWYEQAVRVVAGPARPRFRLADSNGGDLMQGLGGEAKRFVNAPEPMVTLFRQQQSRFYEIGTDRTSGAANMWTDIAYGVPKSSVTVDGVTYSRDDIMAMDEEQRIAIANGAMAELGLMDDIHGYWDERKKFLAQPENRDYAQYHTWQQAVREYPGGYEQYWADLIAGNKNAEMYYNTYIKDETDPAVRERLMKSNRAWFWLNGWDDYVFDKPIEAYGSRAEIWDPVGVANTAPAPIPYEESNAEFNNEIRELPVFLSDMQTYDTAVQQKMTARGYPPGTSFKDLPSKQRIAIEDELEAEGVYEPKPTWQQQKYLEWVEQQPPGADVSPEAFMAANQIEQYEKMPGQTENKVNSAQPIPGPDIYGNTPQSTAPPNMWNDIFNLLNEYDHNRYKDPWSRP